MNLLGFIISKYGNYAAVQGFDTKIDYVGGTNAIYVAWAPRGSAENASVWFIIKITWDVNDNPTYIQSSLENQRYDLRATLF